MSQAKRDKKYAANMAAKGFRKCILWVHDGDREKLQEYAKQLKEERNK